MGLKARKYNTKVKILRPQKIFDGYSGYTTENVLVAEVFARKQDVKTNPYIEAGADEKNVNFTIRKRFLDAGDFIVWKGFKYVIKDKVFNQLSTEIRLTCTATMEQIMQYFVLETGNGEPVVTEAKLIQTNEQYQ